ncbi:pentapeptide repeat-containing protein [Methyloceanibacter sp.]|uniref:pentapeptide repeat-containing protein n=1 Tax=Methyloceanibacter sp. TaxID=1965321 RepID=UPI003C7710CF
MGPTHGGPINLKAALLRDAELRFATLTTADLAAADLSGADLAHARLDHADLRGANLSASCLDYANLDGAELSGLSLRRASLRFASLAAANLEAADLAGANLTHAGLSEANLRAANLRNARLDYADFAGADLSEANLRGADLQNAKNLTPSQLAQSLGDASTVLPEHLQGSVPWSPARSETAHVAPMLGPSLALRRAAKSQSYRPLLWVAASVWLTAFAAAAWWQYGENDRSPLSSTDRGPSELKIAQLPALTVLRTIDRPDVALFAQGDAPETPTIVALQPSAYAELPALPATGLVGIVQQRPELADVRQVAAEQLSVHSDLGAADRERPAGDSLGPMAYAARLSNPEINLASTGTFETESLAPSAPTSQHFTVVKEAARLRWPLTVSVRPSAVLPVLFALKTVARRPLLESLPAQAIAAVPIPPLERVEPTGAPPNSKVPLLTVRVAARVPETKQQIAAGPAPGDPVLLSVSLNRQTIDVYRGTHLIASSKVSSGMPGHETKPGVFSILEKQRFHHSNIYSGAPMPWMQRLTRSGTALHAGAVPGYPASHGCIRLPFSFAPKLFQMTAVGGNVLVANDELAPKPIEHPNLFQPLPAPVRLALAHTSEDRLNDALEPAPGYVSLSLVVARDADSPMTTAEMATSTAAQAPVAAAPLRILVTRRTPRDRLIGVQYVLSSMGYLTPQNFDGTFGKATAVAIREFQRTNGLPENSALNDELLDKIYEAAGRPTPPEGHLFVRQGFSRVFDVPIAFRNPNEPLGTHFYAALPFAPGASKARWVAFSWDGGDAAKALERLDIPDDVRREISQRLTPGSSLIVADTSVDSAILAEGDDFLVWAIEEPAKVEPPKVKQADREIKQASRERSKVKQTASSRAAVGQTQSDNWSRPARRYRREPIPDFYAPRFFSRW